MRVLIVEDDPDQRRILAMVVSARGYEVVACAGVDEARRAPPCDLALVDRHLPDGDGLEFARSLSGRVVLLTGDEPEADTAGVEVLTKPLRPAELDALLGE